MLKTTRGASGRRRGRFSFCLSMLMVAGMLLSSGCMTAAVRPGRVHHVVICWMRDPTDITARQELIDISRSLEMIPGVKSVYAGTMLPSERPIVDNTFDMALVMQFANEADLRAYVSHPGHEQAVRDWIKPLTRRVVVFDFVE